MSTFLIEKPTGFGEVLPGLSIPGKIAKMGYKGVDTTELIMDDFSLGADDLLGGVPGKGFYQRMDAPERSSGDSLGASDRLSCGTRWGIRCHHGAAASRMAILTPAHAIHIPLLRPVAPWA